MADLNKVNFASNEIIKFDDMDFGESIEIDNLNIVLANLLKSSTGKDLILYGLNVQERSTPSMNVDLTVGLGFNLQDSTIIYTGSQIGPIAIDNGDTTDRIDILEVKVVETDYDTQQRAFKDPATGDVVIQDHDTKTRYTIQTQITKGTAGSGVAPNHTAGWVKLSEITVPANESTAIYDSNIKSVDSGNETEANTGWTVETTSTIRINTFAHLKNIFRLKHSEIGDHNNDVIQEQHIDWGLGSNQVSAEDVPVRDSAGYFSASQIEAVLKEIIDIYASTANGKGASKIGVEDSAGNFSSSQVEAVLKEIIDTYASTASGKGASKIGIRDSGSYFTATNVESALQELYSNPLKHLPVGTIMMYDGSSWTDNSTIPGWYACISANSGVGCPDLENKFIMGSTAANVGNTGGSNTHTISSAELPPHTHNVVLGSHEHSRIYSDDTSGGDAGNYEIMRFNGDHYTSAITRHPASNAHVVGENNCVFKTSSTDLGTKTSTNGGFANNAFDNRPAYYSLIFIRKCA